jgi:hypothetical protein
MAGHFVIGNRQRRTSLRLRPTLRWYQADQTAGRRGDFSYRIQPGIIGRRDRCRYLRSIHRVSASSSAAATVTPAMLASCSNRLTKSVGTEAFTLERFGSGSVCAPAGTTGTCRATVAAMV